MDQTQQTKQTKYPALRTISTLFKISAVITLILGVVVGSAFTFINEIIIFPIIILFGISALFQFAVAELIKVVVDIEYNTRKKANS